MIQSDVKANYRGIFALNNFDKILNEELQDYFSDYLSVCRSFTAKIFVISMSSMNKKMLTTFSRIGALGVHRQYYNALLILSAVLLLPLV